MLNKSIIFILLSDQREFLSALVTKMHDKKTKINDSVVTRFHHMIRNTQDIIITGFCQNPKCNSHKAV